MLKYVPSLTDIVMEEIPRRVSLALEISNCQGCCRECHSPFLREDIGEELTPDVVDRLIGENFGIDCVLLLGEGNDPDAVRSLAKHIRDAHPGLSTAIYSGRTAVEDELFDIFDYVKVGPYIPEKGPLNNPGTNQRLYCHREDITSVFWR